MPNDLEVTFRTGAACWRLYSERSTRRTTCSDEIERKTVLGGDALRSLVALDIGLDDGIEDLVGRQRIGVHLARPQLGRGRLVREWLRESLPVRG